MKSIFQIIFILALAAAFPAYAKDKDRASEAADASSEKMPANVMAWDGAEGQAVLVDKFAKKMFTVKIKDADVEVLGEFPIIYGANMGDKMIRGDNRTPEGVYYITTYRSSEYLLKQYGDYAKIYGAGSFPLNYPNPVDRINKKTGSGIWIHGTNPATNKENTQGCVALRNTDFDILKEKIAVKYPVIIADNLTYLSRDEYQNLRKDLNARFEGFIKSWGESDYDKFKGYIHENYKSRSGVKTDAYLQNKKNLMKIYPKRAVLTDNTKIFMKDKNYVVFDTDQFYCAPNILNASNKKYYFTKAADGNLKLISEEFSPRDARPFIDKEVRKFVDGWAEDWQSQNMQRYMANYSKSFRDRKLGRYDAWKKYKQKIFDKNKKISVKISDISWRNAKGGYAVSFRQDYSSDISSDKGIKTLLLKGCPTQFEIISETWKAR